MNVKKRTLLAATVVVIAATGWFSVKNGVTPDVVVTPVRRGLAIRSATGNVTVIPALDARVVAPETGILVKFGYKEGDVVKKGDIIAEIDLGPWPYQLKDCQINLEKSRNALEAIPEEIQLKALKENFEKTKQLAESGNASQAEVDRARSEIEILSLRAKQVRGSLEYDKAKLDNQIADIRRQIERRTLRAANDGIVMKPAVIQGDQIFSGNAICNLTSTGKVVQVEVNQDDLDTVTKSKRVRIKLFAVPGRTFEGKLSQVLPVGNSSTQRFTVFVDMNEALPAEVLSGQTGEATFVADEHPDALLVPRRALVGTQCYVVKDGVVQKRDLTIGFTTLTDAEVSAGVKAGELVVTKDADLRRDKERVNPVPEDK